MDAIAAALERHDLAPGRLNPVMAAMQVEGPCGPRVDGPNPLVLLPPVLAPAIIVLVGQAFGALSALTPAFAPASRDDNRRESTVRLAHAAGR